MRVETEQVWRKWDAIRHEVLRKALLWVTNSAAEMAKKLEALGGATKASPVPAFGKYKPSVLLRETKQIIEEPAHWTRGDTYARDKDGKCARILDPLATSWTLEGAVRKVLRIDNHQFVTSAERQPYEKAASYLAESTGEPADRDLYALNERMTHASLIAVLDRAIAAAEARGE